MLYFEVKKMVLFVTIFCWAGLLYLLLLSSSSGRKFSMLFWLRFILCTEFLSVLLGILYFIFLQISEFLYLESTPLAEFKLHVTTLLGVFPFVFVLDWHNGAFGFCSLLLISCTQYHVFVHFLKITGTDPFLKNGINPCSILLVSFKSIACSIMHFCLLQYPIKIS